MKRTTLLSVMLLAGALMVSCSNDSTEGSAVNGQYGNQAIEFYQLGDLETRATPYIATTLPNATKFRLYAYRLSGTGLATVTPDHIKASAGVAAEATTSASGIAETFYWPVNPADRLRFFAHYPTNLATLLGAANVKHSGGNMVVNYEMATASNWKTDTKQIDFMYASAQPDGQTTVPIRFQHALARVTVQFKLANAEGATESIKVEEITITNPMYKGTFTVTNATAGQSTSGTTQRGAWSAKTKGTSVTTGSLGQTGNNISTTAWTNPTGSATADPGSLTEAVESFFVIPMTNAEFNTNATQLTVKANYGTSYVITSDAVNLKSLQSNAHVWEAGKHYNYQFIIDVKSSKVQFSSVTVQNWVKTDIPVN